MRNSTIYTLLLVWLLMGCTTDGPEPTEKERRAISLSIYTTQTVTRADSSMLAEPTIPGGQSIGVYAYYHEGCTWSNSAQPNFMWNQEAQKSFTFGEAFSYEPLKYWPNENEDKLSFIAYYPYVSSGTAHGLTPHLENSETGLPTFSFSVENNVKQQVDFLVSDLIPNMPESRDTDPNPHDPFDNLALTDRVRFIFKHMTSKIEFRVTVADTLRKDLAYYTINGISLSNIYTSGLLTPSYDGSQTTFTWSGHTNRHTYPCKTTEAYLLLPQTLDNTMMLTLDYELALKSNGTTYTYDESGNLVPTTIYVYENNNATVQLNTLKLAGGETLLTEWLPNHHYIYIIRLGAHRIDFTGQVVEWGDTDSITDIPIEEP